MSGTSTQVKDLIECFRDLGKKVRDISGTELDALFHAEIFRDYNENYLNLKEFLQDKNVEEEKKKDFVYKANDLLLGINQKPDLKVASMLENNITTYINPDSADVWIMEEPPRRSSGQIVRTFELNRSKYNVEPDQISAAFSYQNYRFDEYYRFRKVLREKNKIIIRSRSEESACYQIFDKNVIPTGISKTVYIRLPGNKIAFENPPTHIFIVCGPENWSKDQYLLVSDNSKLVLEKYINFRQKRSEARINLDDFERNVDYQLLLNKRYAGNWINDLYKETCEKYKSQMPEIVKFNINDGKETIRKQMCEKINKILNA
jgi:hypothetical protein